MDCRNAGSISTEHDGARSISREQLVHPAMSFSDARDRGGANRWIARSQELLEAVGEVAVSFREQVAISVLGERR